MKKYSKSSIGVRKIIAIKVYREIVKKWKEKGRDCSRLNKRLDELLREG